MDSSKPGDLLPLPQRPRPAEIVAQASSRLSPADPAPDALSLLRALRRRWALALALGLLLAGTVGPIAWYVVPRAKYTATATLYVATNPKRIIFEPHEKLADYHTYQKTQQALIKNRKVLTHALGQTQVTALPTIREQVERGDDVDEWLEEQLRVEFPGGSEVLSISLSGDRPKDLAVIVNAVVDSYMEVIIEEERSERNKRLGQLKDLWEKYQGDLEGKRKALAMLAEKVGAHDQTAIAMAQQFKVENLALARKELIRVQSDILRAQAEVEAVRPRGAAPSRPAAAPARAAADAAVADSVERDPDVARLRERIDGLTLRYRRVLGIAAKGQNDLAAQRIRTELESARRQLAGLRERVRGEVERQGPGPIGAPGEGPTDLAGLQRKINVWKAYQARLMEDIVRLENELKATNRGGLDLEKDREEIAIAAEIARKVGAEVEAVKVELGAPDRIQKLAEAKPPKKRDELKKVKAGGVAALGAFVLALLGVSFWEFRARRIDMPDEVFTRLGMRVVGSLPAPPGRARLRQAGAAGLPERRWQGLLVESVDATRTMLLHASQADSVRVVMVTSAVKGEGKTSLACHLATSLTRAGRRTLLVDCDLRRPACHRLFDLEPQPGLCELLRGEATAAEVIREASGVGPDLVPAGRCDGMALQAIAQDGLRALFDEWKRHYDFLIIDTPPILPVADSLLISRDVDGVIFSVLRDVSRVPQVRAACERLMGLGVRPLGVVVSGVQCHAYGSDYYYDVAPQPAS